jgi:5-methylcytosine-specific restriction protein A
MTTENPSSQTVGRRWRSRRSAWLRDELILALDLYRRRGRNPPDEDLRELSVLLRDIPIEPELAEGPGFRTPAAVALKVVNFVAIDPAATTTGMTRGGRADAEVFEEFWHAPDRLAAAALAIRANLVALELVEAQTDAEGVDGLEDAPEGRLLTRIHRLRERNAKLVARRKAQAFNEDARLQCECCGFDFAKAYGSRGEGYIECHHTVPLSTLRPGARTRLIDLALVCSNCHRMIHRRSPWLTIDALRTSMAGAATDAR